MRSWPVTKGVKQGCPLSAILFQLVIEPVLQKLQTTKSTCLGYMEGMAMLFPAHHNPQKDIDAMCDIATHLGLQFNLKKCATISLECSITINNQQIPKISDASTYKYLGTTTSGEKLIGLKGAFESFKTETDTVMRSQLSPLQKLHALRTHLLPKLYHLIQNTSPLQSDLHKIN